MIRIDKLSKSFDTLQVLKAIDLTVEKGKITAILGPNGSGKTTLIKSILGMVVPDRGSISINGETVNGQWAYRSGISYIPQTGSFPENLTVHELIRLIKRIRGQEGDEDYFIELFELSSFLHKRIKRLSGGAKQKVNILLACMFDNDLIIMDEPSSGLDPVAIINLKEYIREQKRKNKTTLFTTHIMSLVEELADEIVFILEGKVYYQGSLAALNAMCGVDNLEQAIASILKNQSKLNGNHVKGLAVQHL